MKFLRVVLAIAVLAVVAAAPASATTTRFTEDVTGETITCASNTYTLQGVIRIAFHESTDALGKSHVTGTVTTTGLKATDADGTLYAVRGSQWFGGNETPNGGVETFTFHLNFIAPGQGTVDHIRVQAHFGPQGFVIHDTSTCAE